MRKWAIALLGVALASCAYGQSVSVYGFGDDSCWAWVASAENPQMRLMYEHWFRGFVSGYNFSDLQHQVPSMPDGAMLGLFIDKYCREKPLNPFTSAAFELVRDMRRKQ